MLAERSKHQGREGREGEEEGGCLGLSILREWGGEGDWFLYR